MRTRESYRICCSHSKRCYWPTIDCRIIIGNRYIGQGHISGIGNHKVIGNHIPDIGNTILIRIHISSVFGNIDRRRLSQRSDGTIRTFRVHRTRTTRSRIRRSIRYRVSSRWGSCSRSPVINKPSINIILRNCMNCSKSITIRNTRCKCNWTTRNNCINIGNAYISKSYITSIGHNEIVYYVISNISYMITISILIHPILSYLNRT